ncbi:MAG TPA: hypothetical protein VGF81_05275 [Solirubrobacteraceae bacterium]
MEIATARYEPPRGRSARIRSGTASDPWNGLVDFLQQANALLACDRWLWRVLLSRGAHKAERAREKIVPIATEPVARAQRAGSLRADLDPLDLPVIQLMVSAIADIAREVSPDLCQRAVTIIIDGLATTRQTPTPLPGKPLGRDQLAAAAIPRHGPPLTPPWTGGVRSGSRRGAPAPTA